jgi:hypothetical protein
MNLSYTPGFVKGCKWAAEELDGKLINWPTIFGGTKEAGNYTVRGTLRAKPHDGGMILTVFLKSGEECFVTQQQADSLRLVFEVAQACS